MSDPTGLMRLLRRFAARRAAKFGASSEEELSGHVPETQSNGSAPLPSGVGRCAPPLSPRRVSESISIILRRQVPIRHGEVPRSWLGGLPMMPDGTEWPRGVNPEYKAEGARPLHFVAQIACADLPPDLWGGLGPREGWLLFFLDNNASTIEDGEQHRVIHAFDLGRERQPPADTGPVHDGMFTGSRFTPYMDQADVPPVWRRWPVDLVALPNQLHHDGPRSFATPPDFASTLYAGMPVGNERDRPPVVDPFNWRCLAGLRKLLNAATYVATAIQRNEEALRKKLVAQGALPVMLDILDAEEARFDASETGRLLAADPATIEAERRPMLERIRQQRQVRLERRARLAALIARYPDPDDMLAFLERERMRRVQWRATAIQRFAGLDAAIAVTDLDTPLQPGHWTEIRAALENDRFNGWSVAYGREGAVLIEEQQETSWQLFGSRVTSAVHEIAADCYVDPARHRLVPADAIALVEPWWRRLYGNRPHRIGGYHDGVQSDAEAGATDRPLLLQLASDDAMQWCWGDAGAIYWFIPTEALAGCAFNKADCHIECH